MFLVNSRLFRVSLTCLQLAVNSFTISLSYGANLQSSFDTVNPNVLAFYASPSVLIFSTVHYTCAFFLLLLDALRPLQAPQHINDKGVRLICKRRKANCSAPRRLHSTRPISYNLRSRLRGRLTKGSLPEPNKPWVTTTVFYTVKRYSYQHWQN